MKNNLASLVRTAALAAALLAVPALALAADQAAVAITKVAPKFPSQRDWVTLADRPQMIEGSVTVSFVVSPTGDVWNAAIDSSTNKQLEQPALAAIAQWKFSPAVKNGQAAAVRATQEFTFTLTDQPADNRVVAALGKH